MNVRYITIPGRQTHHLPPLLVNSCYGENLDIDLMEVAAVNVEDEGFVPDRIKDSPQAEQCKMELAIQLRERYRSLVEHWEWGDAILEWIRQCEISFDSDSELRPLLGPDIWPHAERSSFVELLVEKYTPTAQGVALRGAVGARLTFRHSPPIDYFANEYLLAFSPSMCEAAYLTWARLAKGMQGLFPPERFAFEVIDLRHAD